MASVSPYFAGRGAKRPAAEAAAASAPRKRRHPRRSKYFAAATPPPPFLAALPGSGDEDGGAQGDPGRSRLPAGWSPPRSPYQLVEEWLWHQPWRLLVACILLNKTTGKQLLNNQVLQRVVARWPTPVAMVRADVDELQRLIRPLGLHRNRSRSLQRFSVEYLTQGWEYPIVLHGIGKYADDAYRIFCLGEWRSTKPSDKELKKYVQWLRDEWRSPTSNG